MNLKIIVLYFALVAVVQLPACKGQQKEYLSNFEIIWEKINETYYDPTFGGLNWKDVHDRYKPMIANAGEDEEFYRLINKMLWELKVSHTHLIPPRSFALYEPLVFAEGSLGLDIRLLNGLAVTTSVKSGSPADMAGIRPRYIIQSIDEFSVEQIVRDAERVMPPYINSAGRIARITKAILSRIYGSSSTEVLISYLDGEGKKIEKKILRTKRNGVAVGPNGMFFLAVEFEAKRLDNGIGYIRLNTLQPQFAAQISDAIKSMGNISGIIFDLRGNSGGEIEEIPRLFLKERTLLYLSRSRNGETKAFFDPAENVFAGPLVLLIDPLSGSASELFAGCMQAIGRAVVVGERSPGEAMESDRKIFGNGAIFMYPVAQISIPDGTVLEGRGVVPDIEVGLDREILLKSIDSQLESAIRYIEKEIKK